MSFEIEEKKYENMSNIKISPSKINEAFELGENDQGDLRQRNIMLDKAENSPKDNGKEEEAAVEDEDEGEDDDSFKNETILSKTVLKIRTSFAEILQQKITKWIIAIAALLLYFGYFIYAMIKSRPFTIPDDENSTSILADYVFYGNRGLALFILNAVVILLIGYDYLKRKFSDDIEKFSESLDNNQILQKIFHPWIVIGVVFLGCVIYLAVDMKNAYNLVSLTGIVFFVSFAILLSAHPSNIQWRTLATGLLMQFILGVFVMRVEFGYNLFLFLGDQVTAFLNYTDVGSKLVFDKIGDHFFAFKAMPVVIFFSAVVNLLYYVGAIQYLILKLAWVVNKLMKTSPTESVSATANIFLGQTEAPLLIKPFLPKMTVSELFAIMTGGFATVAGSVLAAYIGFGVPASQLITASIMAAPSGLAIAKTIYPETKKTKATWDTIRTFPKGDASNIFEAFAQGAMAVIGTVAAIIANLIAFTAIFAFVDAIVIWLFAIIDVPNFGITSVLQYLFWPLAFLMGTPYEDCQAVARWLGIKILVNEFVAYKSLGETVTFIKETQANGTYGFYQNGTYPIPSDINMIWNDRSVSISAYALCGFANVASIGVQIGGLSALAPSRAKIFPKLAFKAMIAGNLASFINACIAGLLFEKL